MIASAGCGFLHKIPDGPHDTRTSYHDGYGMRIEYPEVSECASTPASAAASVATAPHALEDPANLPAREMSLEEAINLAVSQSPILRSIGGTVVTTPQATTSVYDPALASANPLNGTEAALSAFDAQYTQQLFWSNNDQPTNRQPFNAGAFVIASFTQRQNATFSNELSKANGNGCKFRIAACR